MHLQYLDQLVTYVLLTASVNLRCIKNANNYTHILWSCLVLSFLKFADCSTSCVKSSRTNYSRRLLVLALGLAVCTLLMSRESVQRGKKKLLYSIENQIAYRLKKRRRKKSKAHTLKKKRRIPSVRGQNIVPFNKSSDFQQEIVSA